MKSKHHKAISEFIWNRKNKPFEFCKLKLAVVGYTAYGGKKFLVWLKRTYNLKEFRENGRVMLQRIPKEESSKVDD